MIQPAARVLRRGGTGYAGSALLLAAVALTGCGSSGGSGPTRSPSSSGGAASSPGASTAGSAGGSADAATAAAVSKAYVTLFRTSQDPATSVAVLQHGSAFKDVLTTQLSSPATKKISATVSKVVLQSPNLATVTFTLLAGGTPVLANTPGYAVKEGGTWKVAAGTFCALLKLENAAPKACDDTTITALPG